MASDELRNVTVVVAAAIERDGRYLTARRTRPPDLAGRWECPGGKVEMGETEEHALIREIREELGVTIAVGARVPGEWVLSEGLVLHLYRGSLVDGDPQPHDDHDAIRWVAPEDFDSVDWLPPDVDAGRSLRGAVG